MHILLVAFIMRYILPAPKGGKKIEENNKKVLPLGPLPLHLEVPCTPPLEVPCTPPHRGPTALALEVCTPPLEIPGATLLVPPLGHTICLGEDPFDICILGFGKKIDRGKNQPRKIIVQRNSL